MTVDEFCERHGLVAFDTNVFVYLFESAGPLADAATAVVNAVSARRIVGIGSTVAPAEVIVGPAHLGDDMMGSATRTRSGPSKTCTSFRRRSRSPPNQDSCVHIPA